VREGHEIPDRAASPPLQALHEGIPEETGSCVQQKILPKIQGAPRLPIPVDDEEPAEASSGTQTETVLGSSQDDGREGKEVQGMRGIIREA
jgi:hypothetical protein